jgi:hypothetical protein
MMLSISMQNYYNVFFLLVPNTPEVEVFPSYSSSQTLQKLFIVTIMNQTASDIA